jgi:hypothetical protein
VRCVKNTRANLYACLLWSIDPLECHSEFVKPYPVAIIYANYYYSMETQQSYTKNQEQESPRYYYYYYYYFYYYYYYFIKYYTIIRHHFEPSRARKKSAEESRLSISTVRYRLVMGKPYTCMGPVIFVSLVF